MAKKTKRKAAVSLLQRAASSLARALTRRSKSRGGDGDGEAKAKAKTAGRAAGATAGSVRRPRREADIPLDQLARTYTPTQTSLKAPFRATGTDRQRDQEYAGGFADDRWNDEDHFTNKSGDPRIGTHGRTYEPGEKNR